MFDDMMRYHPGMLADYTSAVMTYSSELDMLGQEALNRLNGAVDFYNTQQGSQAHAQAQQLIIDAINDGKQVLANHSQTVDTCGAEFVGQDIAAGNSFMSI